MSSIFSSRPFSQEKLKDVEGYPLWSTRMKDHLTISGLWGIVESGAAFERDGTQIVGAALLQLETMAAAIIRTGVEGDILTVVRKVDRGSDAWKRLKDTCMPNLPELRKRYANQLKEYKWQSSSKISTFFSQARELQSNYNEVAELGSVWTDKMLLDMLLASLPSRFNPLLVAINEMYTFEKALAFLTNYEMMLRRQEEEETPVVAAGYGNSYSNRRPINPNIICYNCVGKGHPAFQCPEPPKESGGWGSGGGGGGQGRGSGGSGSGYNSGGNRGGGGYQGGRVGYGGNARGRGGGYGGKPEAAVVATAETPEAAVATTTGTAGRDAETMMGKESASKSRSLSRSVLLGTAGSRGIIGLWTQHHQCTSPMMPRS